MSIHNQWREFGQLIIVQIFILEMVRYIYGYTTVTGECCSFMCMHMHMYMQMLVCSYILICSYSYVKSFKGDEIFLMRVETFIIYTLVVPCSTQAMVYLAIMNISC